MTVNLKECMTFTVSDFSGGLNEFASDYRVADNELIACDNATLRDTGAIKSRPGDIAYVDDTVEPLQYGVKNMHRYTDENGDGGLYVYSNNQIWLDSDRNGQFSNSAGSISSSDGFARFSQWKEELFVTTDYDGIFYLQDTPSLQRVALDPNFVSFKSIDNVFDFEEVDKGGSLAATGHYLYRFTLDCGSKEFWGETGPTCYQFRSSTPPYDTVVKYNTAAVMFTSGSYNSWNFKKAAHAPEVEAHTQRINIYRAPITSATVLGDLPTDYETSETRYLYYYIGSIEASHYSNAVEGEVLFTDTGVPPGVLMEYKKFSRPPMARFIETHKGKTWLAYVKYKKSWGDPFEQDATTTTHPHRVFICNINNNGNTEPMGFYSDSWFDINPEDGEGITGFKSYRNEFLVVFKSNSMYAIFGDTWDTVHVRQISGEIGCVAPETIQLVDGNLVWLSHSGVYFWGGAGIPQSLRSDNISGAIDNIPASSRYSAVGGYNVKTREYLLAHSGPGVEYNGILERFDVRTGSWMRDTYPIDYGPSSFCSQKATKDNFKFLAGMSGNPAFMGLSTYYSILELNNGTVRGHSTTEIPFSFQTKFFDCGSPFADKNFIAAYIDLSANADLDLHIVCDGRMDTRTDDAGGFTIRKPDENDLIWNEGAIGDNERWYSTTYPNVWSGGFTTGELVALDDRCWGKRISIEISGDLIDEVEIRSITIFYKPKEGVR